MTNSDSSIPGNAFAKIIRRAIFFVTLIALITVSLFFTFKGLSSPRGMEQAQLAREIARGNGFVSKVVRPITLWQMEKDGKEAAKLTKFPETYHAPLYPTVIAAVLKASNGGDAQKWRMSKETNVYQLDRIIAAASMVFFLIAIGINYMLVARIFDTTIASTVALLMMLCELMWSLSQSGLPQMLMLMLFSAAMFFLWRGMENAESNRSALISVLASGVFMCLLVLTHWITIWIFIGYLIFVSIHFKPRGLLSGMLLLMLALFVTPVVIFLYLNPTGSPFGTAYYAIHDGLGGSEDSVLRSLSPDNSSLALQGLLLTILSTTLRQITSLYENLGSILAAPIFFLALLHPFKRNSLATFRWAILLMWVFASIGMTIYGLRDKTMSSNQIHILFAPLMAAYGLAMVAILWSRLNVTQTAPGFRHAHLVLIVAISAGPMLLSIPKNIKNSLHWQGRGGAWHYPTYFPQGVNRIVADNTQENEVIISDTPWAVAWYADRVSVWLPENVEQIEQIENLAKKQQTPVVGVMISPYSYNRSENILSNSEYAELFPLVYNSMAYSGGAGGFVDKHPDFQLFAQNYRYRAPLIGNGIITFYFNRIPTTGGKK